MSIVASLPCDSFRCSGPLGSIFHRRIVVVATQLVWYPMVFSTSGVLSRGCQMPASTGNKSVLFIEGEAVIVVDVEAASGEEYLGICRR